jgi:hypothetical protein
MGTMVDRRGAHGIHGKGDGRWEEKENDYENEERSRAEKWPTEYTEHTERGTRGENRISCPRNMRSLRRIFEERAVVQFTAIAAIPDAMAPGPKKVRRQGRARCGNAAS